LAEGLAGEHPWVPNSGWVSFRIRGGQDLNHALWLLRLSLVRYLLKAASDPRQLLEKESKALQLSPRLQSLLQPFIPKTSKQASSESLPA